VSETAPQEYGMKNYSVVLAADLPTAEDTIRLVEKVASVVDGVKIGVATMMEAGTGLLKKIRDYLEAKPLLVDLKVADIGFSEDGKWCGTNAKIIKALEHSGATHVTVHGFPGPSSVSEAVQAARDVHIGVLLLPLMSHAGARMFFSRPMTRSDLVYATLKAGIDVEFPRGLPCEDVTDGILLLGEALGVEGYIGPATRPEALQRYRCITERPIWCPGFGRQDRQGRSLEEQFRQWAQLVGPASAAIVGSTIFRAADPLAAAQEIAEIRDRVISSLEWSPPRA